MRNKIILFLLLSATLLVLVNCAAKQEIEIDDSEFREEAAPSLQIVSQYESTMSFTDLEVKGKYLILSSNSYTSISILKHDFNSGKLEELGFSEGTFSNIRDLNVLGDYAYVVDINDGFGIVDVSNPSAPYTIIEYKIEIPTSVDVFGDYAYVTNYGRGLNIFDINDKNNPVVVGFYPTNYFTDIVLVENNLAYLIYDDNGHVQIVDISDKKEPVAKGSIRLTGDTRGAILQEEKNLLYLVSSLGTLDIVDVSDPENPSKFPYSFSLGKSVYSADVAGNYVFMLSDSSEDEKCAVHIIDVTNPEYPNEVISINLPIWGEVIKVSNIDILDRTYVYIVGYERLVVLQFQE